MNVELPEASSLQRTNVVMRKIDEILKHQPGVRYYNAVVGLQHPVAELEQPERSLLLPARAIRGTPVAGSASRSGRCGDKSEAGRDARCAGVRIPAAGDSRNRASVGRGFFRPGSRGQDGRLPLAEYPEVSRRGAQAAGACAHESHLQSGGAATVCRGRQGQGVQARGFNRHRLCGAADPARRLLREPVQPVRTSVEGFRRGGAAVSRAGRRTWASSMCEQQRRDGSAVDAGRYATRRSGRSIRPASTSIAASRSSPRRRRATARARR